MGFRAAPHPDRALGSSLPRLLALQRHVFGALLVLGLAALSSPPLFATDELDPTEPSLLPVPDLLRPAPAPVRNEAKISGGCAAAPLPSMPDPLPFGPGELLTYDVTFLGLRTGSVAVRVADHAETVDATSVYPIYAHAKTSGFLSVLGTLDGRMVSYLDAGTVTPVRMANRFLISTFGQKDVVAREDAAFAGPAVNAQLSYRWSDGRHHKRPARLKSTSDLVDVLSVLYYMRSRAFERESAFCFEIYHRRRLWRVEGTVGPVEVVSAPWGTRSARRSQGVLRKLGGGTEPRQVTAWVSNDADRLPLLVETPDGIGTLAVRLTHFSRGRRMVRARP